MGHDGLICKDYVWWLLIGDTDMGPHHREVEVYIFHLSHINFIAHFSHPDKKIKIPVKLCMFSRFGNKQCFLPCQDLLGLQRIQTARQFRNLASDGVSCPCLGWRAILWLSQVEQQHHRQVTPGPDLVTVEMRWIKSRIKNIKQSSLSFQIVVWPDPLFNSRNWEDVEYKTLQLLMKLLMQCDNSSLELKYILLWKL